MADDSRSKYITVASNERAFVQEAYVVPLLPIHALTLTPTADLINCRSSLSKPLRQMQSNILIDTPPP